MWGVDNVYYNYFSVLNCLSKRITEIYSNFVFQEEVKGAYLFKTDTSVFWFSNIALMENVARKLHGKLSLYIYHCSTVVDFTSEKYSGSTGHRNSWYQQINFFHHRHPH